MSILRAFGYPNRVIAILAPVLAPVVGAFSSWLASKWPDIPKSDLNEIFLAGAIVAVAPALQFMHGQLKWDLQQDGKAQATDGATTTGLATPDADEFADLGIEPPAPADEAVPADDDVAGLLETLDQEEEQEGAAEPEDEPVPAGA
jgi:hypothetical protein